MRGPPSPLSPRRICLHPLLCAGVVRLNLQPPLCTFPLLVAPSLLLWHSCTLSALSPPKPAPRKAGSDSCTQSLTGFLLQVVTFLWESRLKPEESFSYNYSPWSPASFWGKYVLNGQREVPSWNPYNLTIIHSRGRRSSALKYSQLLW